MRTYTAPNDPTGLLTTRHGTPMKGSLWCNDAVTPNSKPGRVATEVLYSDERGPSALGPGSNRLEAQRFGPALLRSPSGRGRFASRSSSRASALAARGMPTRPPLGVARPPEERGTTGWVSPPPNRPVDSRGRGHSWNPGYVDAESPPPGHFGWFGKNRIEPSEPTILDASTTRSIRCATGVTHFHPRRTGPPAASAQSRCRADPPTRPVASSCGARRRPSRPRGRRS